MAQMKILPHTDQKALMRLKSYFYPVAVTPSGKILINDQRIRGFGSKDFHQPGVKKALASSVMCGRSFR